MTYRRGAISLIVFALLAAACLGALTSCSSNQLDVGAVEYYRVSPRAPSGVADAAARKKWAAPPFLVVWGRLGTVNDDGPKFTPQQIIVGGKTFVVTNPKTSNRDHEFCYLFEVHDPDAIEQMPSDLMSGNLMAIEPEKRNRRPFKVIFVRLEDHTTWTGKGTIEQASALTMQSMSQRIDSATP